MLRRYALAWISAFCVAAAALPLSAADETVGESGFYPLKMGAEWEYVANGMTFTAKVVKHEKKGEYMTARIETYVNGQSVMSENLTATKDAVLRIAAADVVASKPTTVIKLPPKAGEKWDIDAEVGPEKLAGKLQCDAIDEKVTVKAGEFTAAKVSGTFTTTAASGEKQEITLTTWYADGTGPVKIIIKTQGVEVTLDLQKYTAGK
jgi:hypothetical protein